MRPRPGKFFRLSFMAHRKASKPGALSLAWRLHCSARRTRKDPVGAMDNTLLVSLSQQLAAYRSMDVIANNLANMSTPGFKRESMKFEEYISSMRPTEGETGSQSISFVHDTGVSRDLRPGTLLTTN